MIAILGSFIQYILIMIFMAIVAAAGIFVGKVLRTRKDIKDKGVGALAKDSEEEQA